MHARPPPGTAPRFCRGRWTALVGGALTLRLRRRAARLSDAAYWARHSGALQRRRLRQILRRAAGTEFGRSHGFSRLAERADADLLAAFRDAVPIADYDAYRDAIVRMRDRAEPDVLWPGLVRDFAQTSGTTAGDKYMPVSRDLLRSNVRASLDIFAHAMRFGCDLSRLCAGRMLFIGGSSDLHVNEHGIRTGDLSGIVTPLIRWPLSAIYSPGPGIALMSHWPSKIEAMARLIVDQDIRMVSGMPSWGTVLFQRVLELARQRGLGETLRDVWPNFELFVHGGVKYAPFEPRVRELYSGHARGDDIPRRLELYPASEAFVAIQDTPGDPGLRLLVDNFNVFEFVPAASIHDPGARALACDEVEPGERYVVVLTTCAGLYRYILGDVVVFDTVPRAPRADAQRAGDRPAGGGRGVTEGPARLRIVGRHRLFINAFGENLIVENIENAVAAAARATGLIIGEFTAAPVYPAPGRRPGLELAVELDPRAADRAALDAFRRTFDEHLKRECVDYTVKRTGDLGMADPTVTALPPGTISRWLESRGKLGGQHKCPRCANHREIIDEVLQAAGTRPA